MATHRKRSRQMCLLGAMALGLAAAAGHADAQRDGHRWNDTRHVEQRSVGTLFIDGNRYNLEGRRSIAWEIREALRCAGYRAYVSNGCVTVRYRSCQPRISISGCEYGLKQTRSRGCITLRPYHIDHEYREPVRRHRDNWRSHRRSDSRWHYTPRWRSRCNSGINVWFDF